MKIIYTQRKPKSQCHKHISIGFECLALIFVMCFFGMLLARQKMNSLEEVYESVDASYGEAMLDAIELVLSSEEKSDNG